MDPSKEQWRKIMEAIRKKNHLVVLDSAYQGLATGDIKQDAFACQMFSSSYGKMIVCQSFSKIFGLYGERTGVVSVVTDSPREREIVMSNLKMVARSIYSNPPIYGARLIDIVLHDKDLTALWHDEVKMMAKRIADMRQGLYDRIIEKKSPHNWNHILNQSGMFAFTGLTPEMIKALRNKYHIYMTEDGRMSMCGLNTKNL